MNYQDKLLQLEKDNALYLMIDSYLNGNLEDQKRYTKTFNELSDKINGVVEWSI